MPDGRLLKIVVRDGLMSSLRRLANVVAAIGLFVVLACPLAVQAISPVDLGASRPDERVLDDAEVFSRASRSELNARLQDLAADRVDARVVTLRRLDYGLNLDSFGEELLTQWSSEGSEPLIQTRIAKGGEVGVIQSLSAETLTDVNKRIKDFAPKLADQEVQRVIRLSQGDAQDVSDAIKLLSDKTGKPYQVIRTFVKTIDTTISSATKPIPSEFVFEEPYVIGSFEKGWKKGQGDPVFPYISSTEELQAEFKNVNREVTEIVVHWTETPTNKNIGSEEINKIHLESGLNGIGYHYVIRRDGSLQRGRPINIQGEHAPVNKHNERSIGIVFVGGINVPSGTSNLENFISVQSLTRSQFNTFDHLCRAFFARFPGGQAVGHNDIDPIEDDPGFNVREYVLANFGKVSKFTDPLKQSPFTIDEINNDE